MQAFLDHWLPGGAHRAVALALLLAMCAYLAALPWVTGPGLFEIWHYAGSVFTGHAASGDYDYARLKPEGQNFYKLSPAFTLFPMWPLSRLPIAPACALFNVLNALCLAAGLIAFLSRLRPAFAPSTAFAAGVVFLALFDLNINGIYGQVTGILVGCMLGGIAAFASGRMVLAGALLAYASNVKLYPLVVALLLCTAQKPRYLLSFAAFLVFFYLSPALVVGWHANLEFHKSLFALLLKEGNYQYHFTEIHHHYSLRAFLQNFFGPLPGAPLNALTAGVALALAVGWFRRFRSGMPSGSDLALFLLNAFPFILLFNTRTEGPATVHMGALYAVLLVQAFAMPKGPGRRAYALVLILTIFTLSFSITDLGKALHVNKFFWKYNLRTLPVLLLMALSAWALWSPGVQAALLGRIGSPPGEIAPRAATP